MTWRRASAAIFFSEIPAGSGNAKSQAAFGALLGSYFAKNQ